MRKLFIFLASIVLLGGCSKKNPVTFENDTDDHDWINQQTIKDIPNAHSGLSASVLDSVHQYSLGFRKTIESIGIKPKKIEFSYWLFVKSENHKASTILSIDFEGKNIDWQGRPVTALEINKWVQVVESFTLPKTINPNYKVSLYVWQTSKEEVVVDDLMVTFK